MTIACGFLMGRISGLPAVYSPQPKSRKIRVKNLGISVFTDCLTEAVDLKWRIVTI
jgi:hypothetical protein